MEIFKGFEDRYAELLEKLVRHSYKKFLVHKHKGDWRLNPNKNLWEIVYKEMCEEAEELNEAWEESDENFYDELGDILNYLIIALDLRQREEKEKNEHSKRDN